MIEKNFIPNKTALITLIAACLVVIISLGNLKEATPKYSGSLVFPYF